MSRTLSRSTMKVSSALLSAMGEQAGEEAMRVTLEALAREQARQLSLLFGEPQGHSVLSLCTGYDAAVEILALRLYLGDLRHYVAIEVDESAAAFCQQLLDATPPPGQPSVRCVQGDLREPGLIPRITQEEGPFDLCIALRPPLVPTAYGDQTGRRLSSRVDAPIFVELLRQRRRGSLTMPVGLVFFEEEEGQRIAALCSALGETALLRGLSTTGLHLPRTGSGSPS